LPNPGYKGQGGYVATITFKAKKQGSASIIFTEGAIRENDGLGTDILTSKIGSTIQIGVPKVIEVPIPTTTDEKSPVPAKPVIYSETHPNQNSWYSKNTATFSWKIPNGVTSIQTLYNKTSNSIPTISYDSSVSQKTFNNLSDGTSYFHLRFINQTGRSEVAHYKINIDTKAPVLSVPTVRTIDGKNIIKLEAKDESSKIDYYTIAIDGNPLIKVFDGDLIKGEYTLPVLMGGAHNLIINVYDSAGNYDSSNITITSKEISSPLLSLNSKEIKNGESVVVSGKTNYPGENVVVVVEIEGKELHRYDQKISSDGSFSIITDKIKQTGLVTVWAQILFSENVSSPASEKVYLKVNETEVVRVTLSIFYPLLGLIVVISSSLIAIFLLYLGWHKFFGLKKKINKELEDTSKDIHKAMLLLKEELNSQLESLENIKQDRSLNKKEETIFKQIQKNVDSIDSFVENKLKNIIKNKF